jgi:hypothetical protein
LFQNLNHITSLSFLKLFSGLTGQLEENPIPGQARWCTPVMPTLRKPRQEDCKFEVNLVYLYKILYIKLKKGGGGGGGEGEGEI